jgi:hypothetical protein
MLKSNRTGALVSAKNQSIVPFALTGISRSEAQRAVQSCLAVVSIAAQATVDCIKESNSVDEIILFTKLNPSVYVSSVARTRIKELSSSGRESIVIGGHETNE